MFSERSFSSSSLVSFFLFFFLHGLYCLLWNKIGRWAKERHSRLKNTEDWLFYAWLRKYEIMYHITHCVQTHMNTISRIRKTNPATTHAMTIFFRSSTRRSRSRYSHRVPIYPVSHLYKKQTNYSTLSWSLIGCVMDRLKSHLHEGVFCTFTKRQTPWIQ